ncbi:hypothetical protein EOE67_10440 [Rheinheimera riviphila]|uniref:Uncharacterized protein n=1 Tax=Rheinheimera riviphila TaxID=1834037 RepID=A0A437QS24_9GAMM|nr:hypothetical protein EOE67_10440 [Rheinheimera riviphila]
MFWLITSKVGRTHPKGSTPEFVVWQQMAVLKSVSPVASFFLLLRQKKETKEKATPDRSKARKFVSILRQLRKLAIC